MVVIGHTETRNFAVRQNLEQIAKENGQDIDEIRTENYLAVPNKIISVEEALDEIVAADMLKRVVGNIKLVSETYFNTNLQYNANRLSKKLKTSTYVGAVMLANMPAASNIIAEQGIDQFTAVQSTVFTAGALMAAERGLRYIRQNIEPVVLQELLTQGEKYAGTIASDLSSKFAFPHLELS